MLRRPTAPRSLLSSITWRRSTQALYTRPLRHKCRTCTLLATQKSPTVGGSLNSVPFKKQKTSWNGRNQRLFSSTEAVVKPISISMPALSPTMSKGKISKWNVGEGDALVPGSVLCEIETDKATVDFENQDEGYLGKILLPEGSEDVPVGDTIAYMVETKEEAEELANVNASDLKGEGSASQTQNNAPASPSESAASSSRPSTTEGEFDGSVVMPSARHLMIHRGISPSDIRGTGKSGRITKGDVVEYLESGQQSTNKAESSSETSSERKGTHSSPPLTTSAQPKPQGASLPAGVSSPRGKYRDEKASGVRKVIAQRLSESKGSNPHLYIIMDCQTDNLIALRKSLKGSGANVSMNDLVVKASAKALKDVPQANVTYNPNTGEIEPCSSIDISVAVATEGGLITPIVKEADKIGLLDMNENIKDLAKRARAGKLQPEEYQGGSFTISNLGMFGIDEFTAVINPPQACIMAVGQGQRQLRRPVNGGDPEPATVMSVQLSADRRAVDEMSGGQFLQVFQRYIEQPHLLVT